VNAFTADERSVAIFLLIILALLAVIGALWARPRRRRSSPLTGEDLIHRELAEIGRRLGAVERSMGTVMEVLPLSVRGVGIVRYNPFSEMGGNMSFSLALLDGRINGVVISVLNDRQGSRVYGKMVEKGTSAYPLSDEEQQALAIARGTLR
jgi:Protein of unknown function (DUF4446)